jgi:hypothetical protein
MKNTAQRSLPPDTEPVRILGRGLRAARGVRLTLKTIREATGKTQVAVAGDAQMDQGDISRLEGRVEFDDCQLATLRRYVEALGGKLDLVAVFGDKRITIVAPETTTAKAKSVLQRTGRKAPRR